MKVINDSPTLPGKAAAAGDVQMHRTASVKFAEGDNLSWKFALHSYKRLSVVAAASMNSGDGLFVSYGDTHSFDY